MFETWAVPVPAVDSQGWHRVTCVLITMVSFFVRHVVKGKAILMFIVLEILSHVYNTEAGSGPSCEQLNRMESN